MNTVKFKQNVLKILILVPFLTLKDYRNEDEKRELTLPIFLTRTSRALPALIFETVERRVGMSQGSKVKSKVYIYNSV